MTAVRKGSDIPDDRCGYTFDTSSLSEWGTGEACCWRPVWDDHDLCIWHADEQDKPREELEEALSDHPERLEGALISSIDLSGVDWFEGARLVGAEFTDVDLREASFEGTDLREVAIDNVDARHSDFTEANFEGASVTSSDLRSVTLVDARFDQAVLSNIRINRETDFGDESVYERELHGGEDADGDSWANRDSEEKESYLLTAQAAIWSYREIQDLYRENALPYQARRYYYKEKNMRRRVAWHTNSYLRALRAEGSRWVTGYGMNPWRVVAAALVVIVICAIAYPLTGGIQETVMQQVEPVRDAAQATNATNVSDADPSTKRITVFWSVDEALSAEPWALFTLFLRSLYFSVITFTTLGYGDLAPIGGLARTIAGLESLVGALLTALLVFVLSRRIS